MLKGDRATPSLILFSRAQRSWKRKNILCGRECTVPLPDGRTNWVKWRYSNLSSLRCGATRRTVWSLVKICRVIRIKLNHFVWENVRIITILLRKRCHYSKHFAELAPHHGGKQLSQIYYEEITPPSSSMYACICILTWGVDGDFRDAQPFLCCVRTSNNDVAKLLSDWSAGDRDRLTASHRAIVPSTERVWVRAERWTLVRPDIRHADLNVVQTDSYTAVQIVHSINCWNCRNLAFVVKSMKFSAEV